MIKMFCNVCKEEMAQDENFLFEATIIENIPIAVQVAVGQRKQMQKSVVHVCRKCYQKTIKSLLYG